MAKTTEHSFYCIQCGKKGIPLARKNSLQHERFHRKKLYCPWCKMTVNHIECRSQEDVYIFQQEFEEGIYKDELKESLNFVQKEESECVKYYT